jgi:hypothetical protein
MTSLHSNLMTKKLGTCELEFVTRWATPFALCTLRINSPSLHWLPEVPLDLWQFQILPLLLHEET